MAVNTDEERDLDPVPPDSEIGVVGIDHLFRMDLRVFGTIVGHGNDHHIENLSRQLQKRLPLCNPFRMPGAHKYNRPGKIVGFFLV